MSTSTDMCVLNVDASSHGYMQVTKDGKPLPYSAYRFVFPMLRAVLSSSVHTPVHEAALSVVALHCAAGDDIPRMQSLELLYLLLGVVPAYK